MSGMAIYCHDFHKQFGILHVIISLSATFISGDLCMLPGENSTYPASSMSMWTLLYDWGYMGAYMVILYADTVTLENYNTNVD